MPDRKPNEQNMTNKFSDEVLEVLTFSKEEAARLASPNVMPEHLLLAILRHKGGAACSMMQSMNVDLKGMKQQLEQNVAAGNSAQTTSDSIELSEQASNILKLAILQARLMATETVSEMHLLLAILHDPRNNGAKNILEERKITYDQVMEYSKKQADNITKNGIGMQEEEEEDFIGRTGSQNRKQGGGSTATDTKTGGDTPILDNFGTDLTLAAEEGKLDPIVGRENEINRVCEILCRRKKNNPILIGEPGVGKSAIVEGLATLIAKKHTSPVLFNKRVMTLDLGALVAGTKYRGQFEERVKALVKEIENHPNIIVFIDEIHTLVGAGSAPGTMDAANMLKPALARGTIQCIGATTLDEYRKSIEKDGALERRFQKVIVEQTTPEETIDILTNIKERYEHYHAVRYSDEAIKACVAYTDRYVTERQFPDKAIDALDEAGAKAHLQNAQVPPEITETEKEIAEVARKKQNAVRNQNFELAASFRDKQTELQQKMKELEQKYKEGNFNNVVDVTEDDVARVVSVMAGIPAERITETESARLRNMGETLKGDVVAQDRAIEKVVKAIQRNRIGLRDPNHPIGAFMFLGPTGVGKTYLAKKLAENIFGSAEALIRIDMSEYSESFNTSRLVGAPPGYVGYDEGGQLTERVRRRPYSIVLLDEIEKAHGNVFNMLLQVLDEGRLTDGNGRLVDFRNTIIIMTSNAGTRQLKEFGHGVGFNAGRLSADMQEKDKEYARSIIQKSLSKQFSPEFLNRLDEIITFDQLDLEAIKKIIDIELRSLTRRLTAMGYEISITDKAKEFVAEKGYDVQFGARPLKRAIQTYIEDGICQMILNDELKPGTTIDIGKDPDKEELTFQINSEKN